jgi:hypothetical protein
MKILPNDLVFVSYGSFSSDMENYFVRLKRKNSNIKRIHGIRNDLSSMFIAASIVNTEYFDYIDYASQKKITLNTKNILKNEITLDYSDDSGVDIIYLTYKELQAEQSFKNLLKKYPNLKQLHGVQGLTRAFRFASELSETRFYTLIDGDNEVLDSFDLNKVEVPSKPNTLSLYMARNPINDLVYGYGGIKVCPTYNFRRIKDDRIDPVASGGIKGLNPIFQVASVTRFNTSAFNAWKAGFREAVMLSAQMDAEVKMSDGEIRERLNIWQTKGTDRLFGKWGIQGAIDGERYSSKYKGNLKELLMINDPVWLKDMFELHKRTDNGLFASLICKKYKGSEA